MATDTLQLINGSVLEGGGQILRNAISLSALLQKPIRIEKIRHGRSPPGLKNQHRTGLQLVQQIASAELRGASNGSTQVEFIPGQIELPGHWTADTVTAGATTLLMQIALPLLLFKSWSAVNVRETSVLNLLGGTNAGQAPQADYTQHIFLPFLRSHFLPLRHDADEQGGPSVELDIQKRGYYPKGGGKLEVRVQPLLPGEKLRPVRLGGERGRLVAVRGVAHYAGLPKVIGEGMREGAIKIIKERVRKMWFPGADVEEVSGSRGDKDEVVVDIKVKREPNNLTKGAGSGIVLWAEFENGAVLGGSAVGKKGIEPAEVGRSAVEELGKSIEADGCVEEWMQDQMIIFMALAEGKSEVRCGTGGLSLHTRTAIWVAEQLTNARFEVEQEESGQWFIRCDGIGFTMHQECQQT